MVSFNRDDRQMLRRIQAHLRLNALRSQAAIEQIGTVDVLIHPQNTGLHLNCIVPHKGVAWVRREDLLAAFTGMEHLGRVPRLLFLDALFPAAFQQQLTLMGLALEEQWLLMAYAPLYGPHLPDEVPRGQLPGSMDSSITATIASTPMELAAWLRIFRAAYYNTEALIIRPDEVEPLLAAVESGESLFITACYENTPLGAARITLLPPSAEIEVVVTAPLWHGMGLEEALIETAVHAAQAYGCGTIFTLAPSETLLPLYHRLGFIEMARMLAFWRQDDSGSYSPRAIQSGTVVAT